MNKPKSTVSKVTDELVEAFHGVNAGTKDLSSANTLANIAGKIFNGARIQMEYSDYKKRGKYSAIDILEDN